MTPIAVIILGTDFKLNWKSKWGCSVTIHLVIRKFLTYDWKRWTSHKRWVLYLLDSDIPASCLTKKKCHFWCIWIFKSNMSATQDHQGTQERSRETFIQIVTYFLPPSAEAGLGCLFLSSQLWTLCLYPGTKASRVSHPAAYARGSVVYICYPLCMCFSF